MRDEIWACRSTSTPTSAGQRRSHSTASTSASSLANRSTPQRCAASATCTTSSTTPSATSATCWSHPRTAIHEMTTFLTMWALEEYWHGEALGSVLAAHGEASGGDRVGPMRMRLRVKESLSPLFFGLGSAIAGRSFAAIHMTWGAINEWTARGGVWAARAAGRPSDALAPLEAHPASRGWAHRLLRIAGDQAPRRRQHGAARRLGSPFAASGPRSDPTSCPTKRCGSSTTTSSAARTVGPRSSASTVTSIDCLASPACISPPERARSWLLSQGPERGHQCDARAVASIKEDSERLWQGQGDLVFADHPVAATHREGEEIAEGVLCLKSIASVNALDTGDGLVMLDTGGEFDINTVHREIRGWRPDAPRARRGVLPPPRGPRVRHEAVRGGSDREGLAAARRVCARRPAAATSTATRTRSAGTPPSTSGSSVCRSTGSSGPSTTAIPTSRTRTG